MLISETDISRHSVAQPAARLCVTRSRLALVVGSIAACFIMLAVVIACRALAPSKPPLRVAISPWPGYEFATLAQQKGFFAEEGVRVEICELSSLSDTRRAFERGQVDGFFATLVEVILAKENGGRSPRVTLVADWSDGADVIIGGPGIGSVAGLKSHRVAVESGSLNPIVLARALELHGLTLDDVELVSCAQLKMRAALELGAVDAVVTYPPISLAIDAMPDTKVIFTTKEIPNEIVDVMAFDESVIRSRPADVEAFRRAFFRAQEYAKKNPKDAMAIMAKRERITPADFEAALTDGIRLVGGADQGRFLSETGTLRDTARRTRESMAAIGIFQSSASREEPAQFIGD